MAKKKSKKKSNKKKDIKKKKLIKLKLQKKKDAKKKVAKKKEAKKKDAKKKDVKKKSPKKKVNVEKSQPVAKAQPVAPIIKNEDHSSKYNVKDAIKKLRTLKSKDELLSFTKGEKRLTVTRIIPAAMSRLK